MKGAFLLAKIKRSIKVIKKMKNWQDYFLNSVNLIQKKYVTFEMKNGLFFILRAKTLDKNLFAEIVLEKDYPLDKIDLPKASVIIDLGAQNGFFSVYASKKAKKIFSFEPVPENFELLVKNIELNKLENKIIPFNLALSDKTGKERIFLSGTHTGCHSIYGYLEGEKNNSLDAKNFLKFKDFSKKNFIEVNSITLNEIFRTNKINHCDLLKMDIEGAEYKVLYCLPDSCFNKIQRITMECHDIDERKNNMIFLIGFLKSKGFKVQAKTAILFAER